MLVIPATIACGTAKALAIGLNTLYAHGVAQTLNQLCIYIESVMRQDLFGTN